MSRQLHTSDCFDQVDDDGEWLIVRCACGWQFGPVPDWETAADVLMDHARSVGYDEGQAGA